MRGAGLVIVLMWLIFMALAVVQVLSVDLAATFEGVTP